MVNKTDKKQIKVRVIKEGSVEKKQKNCRDEYMDSAEKDRARRIKELNAYHDKLYKLQQEEQRLIKRIKQLQSKYEKMKSVADGINTEELWNYCSKLNDVSKGKFDDKDKK